MSVAPVPPTKETIVGEFADAVLAEFDSVGKPIVEGLIQTGEVNAVAALSGFLKNIPAPGGLEGALVKPVEAAFESAVTSYATAAVAKYGPDAIFAFVDAYLHSWAKSVGG